MTPSPPPGLPDRYRYLRILGRGGFGSVWAMHDEILGRPVAVKVLEGNLDEEGAARFLREARVTAELRHPQVVAVLDFGRTDAGASWISYELVEGSSLARREVPEVGREDLIRWGRQLASALHAAHAAGIVHRDVKPDNVMIRGADAVLLDFGVARDATEKLTATGMILGTPGFMAPELWTGTPASPVSDQWALAATLWTVATGAPVYGSEQVQEILSTLGGGGWKGPPRGALRDPHLETVLGRALAPDPGARFPDLATLGAALGGTVAAPRVAASATTKFLGAPPPAPPEEPRPFQVARTLGACALAGILAFVLVWGRTPGPPAPTFPTAPSDAPALAPPGLENLRAQARRMHQGLAGAPDLPEVSLAFMPSHRRVDDAVLADRRLPQRYQGLLQALGEHLDLGDPIPELDALRLARPRCGTSSRTWSAGQLPSPSRSAWQSTAT